MLQIILISVLVLVLCVIGVNYIYTKVKQHFLFVYTYINNGEDNTPYLFTTNIMHIDIINDLLDYPILPHQDFIIIFDYCTFSNWLQYLKINASNYYLSFSHKVWDSTIKNTLVWETINANENRFNNVFIYRKYLNNIPYLHNISEWEEIETCIYVDLIKP